jgi:uncharacterized protein (DUF1697 family)
MCGAGTRCSTPARSTPDRQRHVARLVALLRAVNVGGRSKVPMAELRALAASLGYGDPVTYIQSGNLVITTDVSPTTIERVLADAIERELGVSTVVIVRTAAQMVAIAAADPYADEVDPTKRSTVFFTASPDNPDALASDRFAPDRFTVLGSEMYLHLPQGMGKATFSMPVVERALGVRGTARNATSVAKLAALAAG